MSSQPLRPRGVVERVLQAMNSCEDAEAFAAFLADEPTALSEEVQKTLTEMQQVESYAALIRPVRQLLADARRDPVSAWDAFRRTYDEMAAKMSGLPEIQGRLERLNAQKQWRKIIGLVDETLPRVRDVGLGLGEAYLQRHAGVACLYLAAEDATYLEQARRRLEVAAKLLPPPGTHDTLTTSLASDVLINLSVAYGSDPELDPQEALEGIIATLTATLDWVDRNAETEKWATAHTNLCRAWFRRERGGRLANLQHALEHARRALEARSPDGDGDAWVYTQLNYADVLEALAAEGAGATDAADAAWQAIVDAADEIQSVWTVARAHQALAGRLIGRANELREQQNPDAAQVAAKAGEHLERALALTVDEAPRISRGRVLLDAASYQAGWGARSAAIDLYGQAVAHLFPDSPADARLAARRLGELYADDDRWSDAADAYRMAVQAAHLAFHARLYEAGRDRESGQTLNLGRFAAYAIARAGDPQEAVLVLEDMRALEFRRRTEAAPSDLERLASADTELHAAYLAHLAALRAQPLTGISDEVSRDLQLTLQAIRCVPGLEHFGASARLSDIAGAVQPRQPVVYVNPTPHGTVLLFVCGTDDLKVHPLFLDVPGDVIWYRVSVGEYEKILAGTSPKRLPAPYLMTAAGLVADRSVDEALDYILQWLGEFLAEPLAAALEQLRAEGATLICCGPLSAAPLHVAHLPNSAGARCLLDRFTIRFAPSAIVLAEAQIRASANAPVQRSLVAVSNPNSDLPAAHAEVDHIARLFDAAQIADGPEATSMFLTANAANASCIHMACHGRADVGDLSNSALKLADRSVALSELATLGMSSARLVCASACRTALPDLLRSDEAISMATALLASGSPCAVASLWSVPDVPTALLMARFYELMINDGREPAGALRQAQIWMRDISLADLEAYMASRPSLQLLFEEARAAGELPGVYDGNPDTPPFSEEVHWAAFIVTGA